MASWLTLARVRRIAELASFVAISITAPIAVFEFHNHTLEAARASRGERLGVAEQTYRDVDARFIDFLKLCIDHPLLDCYSVPEKPVALSDEEQLQQKALYSFLTDVFATAYIQYKTNQHELDPDVQVVFREQWQGWDAYIRKFLKRPAYCRVYHDIRDEYDTRLIGFMDPIAASTCPRKAPRRRAN